MRTLRTVLAAALMLGAGLAASAPASAMPPHWHHGPHWGWGWGGAGIGLGLGLGALAIEEGSCIRFRPVYDDFGNFMGRRAVNVCE